MPEALLSKIRDLALRVLRGVRPEEWLLLGLWSIALSLCLATGTGFSFRYIFLRYMRFFATYALVMVGVSRLLFVWGDAWRPKTPGGQRLKRFVFGEGGDPNKTLATDIELMRGLLIFFINLAFYSNFKTRIAAINPAVGDDIFIAMDAMLFGPESALVLERFTHAHSDFSTWLANVYKHDYLWMVVLLWVAYIRREGRVLRWIFTATALTYIVAILVTAAYPSYGPFFLEPDRLEWVNETGVGGAQRSLKRFYYASLPALEGGTHLKAKAFMGIAAFPSLHVGHMVVMGIIALRVVPIYALWMFGVTMVTWIATVAFGWHYWVDAIGGAMVAVACTEFVWWVIRKGPPLDDEAPPD